jgi:hypothetical protein
VQWSYEVLCLALNVPLNEVHLRRLGVFDDCVKNWGSSIDKIEPGLIGINKLPIVPYSPAQVLQAFLNTYGKGMSLLDALKSPTYEELLKQYLLAHNFAGSPDQKSEYISDYLAQVVESGDITKPLIVNGQYYRFMLPNTFFCESRLAPKKSADEPWFQYVGTAVHENYVRQRSA